MTNELKEKLKRIKAVIFDADGVFFTGQVFIDPERGEALKQRSYVDGQGLSFLRAIGIKIAFISGEKTGFLERIEEKLNSLPSVKQGNFDKIAVFTGFQGQEKVEMINNWLKENNVDWSECAAMGDDLADYQLLDKAGLAVAPAQAEEIVKKIADYVTPRQGGKGAIRDFCNLILEAREIDISSLILK